MVVWMWLDKVMWGGLEVCWCREVGLLCILSVGC